MKNMSNHRSTVRDAWNSYRASVMPANAPPVQIQECRRAFYAGMECLMVAIMGGLDPGSDATEGDLDYVAALHQELLNFAQDVRAGRA